MLHFSIVVLKSPVFGMKSVAKVNFRIKAVTFSCVKYAGNSYLTRNFTKKQLESTSSTQFRDVCIGIMYQLKKFWQKLPRSAPLITITIGVAALIYGLRCHARGNLGPPFLALSRFKSRSSLYVAYYIVPGVSIILI